MNRKNAMSTMGYAICCVIILGIIMIISAPMLVSNTKKEIAEKNTQEQNFEQENSSYVNITDELRRIEESLSSRIDQLESAASDESSESSISKKYICTMDKSPEGQLEPVDGGPRKFIFECEYRE